MPLFPLERATTPEWRVGASYMYVRRQAAHGMIEETAPRGVVRAPHPVTSPRPAARHGTIILAAAVRVRRRPRGTPPGVLLAAAAKEEPQLRGAFAGAFACAFACHRCFFFLLAHLEKSGLQNHIEITTPTRASVMTRMM